MALESDLHQGQFHPLSAGQISQLAAQGCSCDDWSKVVDGLKQHSVEVSMAKSLVSLAVGFALSDGVARELSITGAAADAVRAHYNAIGAALATGQSFWLSTTASPDGSDSSVYHSALENAILTIDVLPNRTGSGTIPGVALTVSPGADPLVIADGVQTIGTRSINGIATLRLSFFIPGDSNQHWLTLAGSQEAVFTQFASIVRSINSRWRFGLYAYSSASADGSSYEATLGVDALILSLQPGSGSALPRMTASAIVGETIPIST